MFPLLKPFVKGDSFTDVKRQSIYGVSETDFQVMDTIEDSDIAILTMSWNFYKSEGKMQLAKEFVNLAKDYNVSVWSVNLGDLGVKLPKLENVIVFRSNGFKNNLPNYHKGIPVFIEDPIKERLSSIYNDHISYSSVPIVGFCGYATGNPFYVLRLYLAQIVKMLKQTISRNVEYSPLCVAPYFRHRCLKEVDKFRAVKTNFILRSKYRAGANNMIELERTTKEYFENMAKSQYVLCVRGAGNFSVRFFETLAMGRIPVYVDTNGFIPLDNEINWKDHIVWVHEHEIHKIGQKIMTFHNRFNSASFNELLKSNRKLWESKMTLGGFFKSQSLK